MRLVQPDGWPRPAGYAHAAIASGRLVLVAGQVGWDPVTEHFSSGDFAGQAGQALRNVATVLRAAGVRPEDVVRLTWYITDRAAYLAARPAIGTAYRAIFGSHYPAMSVVVVAGLLEPEARVEIEATAIVPP
jgi:enamine deaminase RidA (YjgF/YER057c/UK114 family)